MKRHPKYKPTDDALKASKIVNYKGMFAVEFNPVFLRVKRGNIYRSGGQKEPFLAKANADKVSEWANINSASVFNVVGNKAIFYNHEDALLCLVTFS